MLDLQINPNSSGQHRIVNNILVYCVPSVIYAPYLWHIDLEFQFNMTQLYSIEIKYAWWYIEWCIKPVDVAYWVMNKPSWRHMYYEYFLNHIYHATPLLDSLWRVRFTLYMNTMQPIHRKLINVFMCIYLLYVTIDLGWPGQWVT